VVATEEEEEEEEEIVGTQIIVLDKAFKIFNVLSFKMTPFPLRVLGEDEDNELFIILANNPVPVPVPVPIVDSLDVDVDDDGGKMPSLSTVLSLFSMS